MAKVTVHKNASPSEQLIGQAEKPITVKDKAGRVFELRNPGVLAQFRLVEVLGAETSRNDTYMQMVLPVIYVAAIDGEVINMPSNKIQLEALIQRLGDAGIMAVSVGVHTNFGEASPDADKAAIKK